MKITRENLKIGTVMRFNDQHDATYAIINIDLTNVWNTYTLLNTNTYQISTSDLRQPRWAIIAN